MGYDYNDNGSEPEALDTAEQLGSWTAAKARYRYKKYVGKLVSEKGLGGGVPGKNTGGGVPFLRRRAAPQKRRWGGLLLRLIIPGSAFLFLPVLIMILFGGEILFSPLSLFYSEAGADGKDIRTVILELDREYDERIEYIKATVPADKVKISGTKPSWQDVLSIYAIKAVTDPEEPTMLLTWDDENIALLRDVYWNMTSVGYRIDTEITTAPVETEADSETAAEGDEHETTEASSDESEEETEPETVEVRTDTLHIVTISKSLDELMDLYNFSPEQREQVAELRSEENAVMWTSMLYGTEITSDTAIVQVALTQLGNEGGEKFWRWFGFDHRESWCACFVSWCADQCGYIAARTAPRFAWTPDGRDWFQLRGKWLDRDAVPAPGMVIFFNKNSNNGPGNPDHVGIVKEVKEGRVYTIEGNSSNKVRERNYEIGARSILGYGIIAE